MMIGCSSGRIRVALAATELQGDRQEGWPWPTSSTSTAATSIPTCRPHPRHLDFAEFRRTADLVGADLLVDMAHDAGAAPACHR